MFENIEILTVVSICAMILCYLAGVYQHNAKMRPKCFMFGLLPFLVFIWFAFNSPKDLDQASKIAGKQYKELTK